MICPQCGYEREKKDDIISFTECPKCGIIYNKWKSDSAGEETISPSEESVPSDSPSDHHKKNSAERLVIYAGIAVVFIILLHAFIVPSLMNFFKSRNNVNITEHIAPLTDAERQPRENPQPSEYNRASLPENYQPRRELSVADIVRENRESVVIIKTSSGIIGSGFFINREGYIVTNKHVLPDNTSAEIKTANGKIFKILQIARDDTDGDLAIAATNATPQESNPVTINATLPQSGEKIIVIGSPLGLEQTVSDGIVSAIRQNQNGVNYIQITAPVSPGNSGGPLLNMRGEVIGVATFQYRTGQNLNFCVAASRIIDLQEGKQSPHGTSRGGPELSQGRDVYCYADSSGQVYFVDWPTGMLVSRPDGSLDRVKFEKWVLEQIGGNPETINPDKEARDDVERNREHLFKSVFPHRSINDTNLTNAEKEWLEIRYQRHYAQVYNQWAAKRNTAIRKYNFMMNEFQKFSASRR